MPDSLKVTYEDVEASQADRYPPVLAIHLSDLGNDPPPRSVGAKLQLTLDDVAAFEPAGDDVIGPLEQLVFSLVNQARQENMPRWLGRQVLLWHPGAAMVARRHSADMLERNYVSHVTPDGINVGQRLDRAAVSYLACGENIGVVYGPASHGTQGVDEVQKAFMNQPRRLTNHRGNILNPVWTHVGIGVA
ncbi:MAG: CAP domain-containing protein [Chloroflexota bacterium]